MGWNNTEKELTISYINFNNFWAFKQLQFEAETVVEDADREAKDRWGMLAYIFSGLKQLKEIIQFTAETETPDKIIKVDTSAE